MSDPLTRLVELAVYAPVGAAALVRDRLPDLVDDGRRRVQQRLTVARFVGQMVVQQGRREVERRLHPPDDAAETGGVPDASTAAGAAPVAPERQPEPVDRTSAADLPIEDYESLAAAQVVARLRDLDPAGRERIERFERAHRNRRTILNRIDQLRAAP